MARRVQRTAMDFGIGSQQAIRRFSMGKPGPAANLSTAVIERAAGPQLESEVASIDRPAPWAADNFMCARTGRSSRRRADWSELHDGAARNSWDSSWRRPRGRWSFWRSTGSSGRRRIRSTVEGMMKKMVVVGLCAAGVAICQQPKFELADVHSSKTSRSAAQNFGGVLRAGKYVNRDVTMLGLIEAAYKVKEDAIAGGPGWVASDLFDIIAKVPEGTKMAEANQMLQSLLADRFKLVVKRETRPAPRYVLTVGKGGSKLKPASGSGQGCQPVQQPGGGRGSQVAFMANIMVECHNMTAAEIADSLHRMAGSGYFDHDLADETK